MTTSKLKLLSAGVGGAAVLTMAGLSVAHTTTFSAEPEPAPPGPVTSTPISTGETVTDDSEAPASPETSVATPEVTVTTTVPEA